MEFGEVKDEQRQQPVTPKKRRKPKPPQANGGSSSSAVESSSLSRTPSTSPTGDGKGGDQQQQDHEQGGGGRKPRLVWTTELHKLFVEAYDSLGDDAVPRKILEKMNEKMKIPEVSREKIASHLQKHKINMRQQAKVPSSHSPTEEAPASHSLRSLPPNTTPLAEEVSHQAQLELVQVLQEQADCLSRRSSNSIATNLHTVHQSIQQLFGPPIKEGEAQPGETMQQRAPAHSGCSPVEGHGWNLENKGCTGQHMETSTAAILVPEANREAVLIRMAEAANADDSIIAQFWEASPGGNEASSTSWDIFGPEQLAERNCIACRASVPTTDVLSKW